MLLDRKYCLLYLAAAVSDFYIPPNEMVSQLRVLKILKCYHVNEKLFYLPIRKIIFCLNAVPTFYIIILLNFFLHALDYKFGLVSL